MASSFAGGTAVRLSILLLIAAVLGGVFAYDYYVTGPKIKAKLVEFESLTNMPLERPEMSPEERERFENMTDEEQEEYEKSLNLKDLLEEQRQKRMKDPTFTKEGIRKKVSLTPVETMQIGEYEVEHYRLGRTLPLMPGGADVYAVFRKDYYLGHEGERPTQKSLDKRFNLSDGTEHKPDYENLPTASAGG